MTALLDGLRTTVTRWLGTSSEPTSILVALPQRTLWSHEVSSSELTLTCHEGWIWLTREGDPRDYMLAGGQSVRLDRPGRVVVQALRPSRFSLGRESPSPKPMLPPFRTVGR